MMHISKTTTETVLEIYNRNPALRFLITTFVPVVGSVLDVTATQMWHLMQTKRMRVLIEELDKGNVLLTEEQVAQESFVHCFMVTSQAVVRTNRHKKIALFARLLESVVSEPYDLSIDEYEEFLLILDDLSYREILALRILDKYSDSPREIDQNDLQWTDTFWEKFVSELSKKLHIQPDELKSFLARLARTGCYEVFVGYYDAQGDQGQLTPTYERLKSLVYRQQSNG